MDKWYIEKGENGETVLSTRIRLARNIDEFLFPEKLDIEGRKQVNGLIKNAVVNLGFCSFDYLDMNTLSRVQAVSLAERHLISPEFAVNREERGLLLTKDESISIMLCEEDHIRLQVMKSGLALKEAYETADKIDSALDKALHYAFDSRLGYLTQCPTNLGTAMRASVMLHLPALTKTGRIRQLVGTISKLGLTLRGAYGEGSASNGDIYQLSNQITLGITEKSAIDNLNAITMQIVNQERKISAEIIKNPAEEDRIFRAYGILKNSRILSCDEFMELISIVRMGVCAGLIDLPLETVNKLIFMAQPATIVAMEGKNMDAPERDALRALLVRDGLGAS